MSNIPNIDTPKVKFDSIGVGLVLYAYGILLGASYLFAFWRPFGFSIFPFLSLQDYVTVPLNRVVVLIAPPLLAGFFFLSEKRGLSMRQRRPMLFILLGPYSAIVLLSLYKGGASFLRHEFYYRNEIIVMVFPIVLCIIGWVLAIKLQASLSTHVVSLVFVQLGHVVAAGYTDGKTVFNGAAEAYFLENKELCEEGGVRDWVYLGKFSKEVIFMNTIDKRLCITDEMSFRLIPRKFSENL